MQSLFSRVRIGELRIRGLKVKVGIRKSEDSRIRGLGGYGQDYKLLLPCLVAE